jgi:hypothetical protein
MSDKSKEPARNSAVTITDTLVRAMEDIDGEDFTRCVIIAMNDEGTHPYLYSNARSECEMFGMIEMSGSGWADDVSEENE